MRADLEKLLKSRPGKQRFDPAPPPPRAGESRRAFLKTLALGCGGLLSPILLAGGSAGSRRPGGPVRAGQALTEAQMRLLRAFAETIIPRTDTPGAAETDTHGFIDDQLANCRAPDEAKRFIADLEEAGKRVQAHWKAGFPDLGPKERHAAMTAIAHRETPFDGLGADFFRKLKSLILLGYYSSQAGASRELVYLPIAGGYDGDFKLSDNGGKAFSPHVY